MQSGQLDVLHSLVDVHLQVLHQEPERLLLAGDGGLVQRLSSESIGGRGRSLGRRGGGEGVRNGSHLP